MVANIIKDIKRYIEFLKSDYSLYVTLHPKEYEELISTSELFSFNMHTNPYCLYLKKDPMIAQECINCQRKVFERCKDGEFAGVCHAGVLELIYPFKSKGKIIGFISVSGYRAPRNTAEEILAKISFKYNINLKELSDTYYGNLKSKPPIKSEIDILLRPLCYMLELAYGLLPEVKKDGSKDTDFYTKVLYYLNQNRSSQITLKEVCRDLYCSKSYVSHIFKSYNGKSIKEYLNTARIKDAEMLLVNSNLNMTQIALSIGFSDSNYFAVIFKKIQGITPTEYRKKYRSLYL